MPTSAPPSTRGGSRELSAGFVARHGIDGLDALEFEHRPGHAVPEHRHEWPVVAVPLQGGFDWRQPGRKTWHCGPGCALVVPAVERHEERVHALGAHSLLIAVRDSSSDTAASRLANERALVRTPRMNALAVRCRLALRRYGTPDKLEIESLAHEILYELPGGATSAGSPPWLTRAREMLDDDPFSRPRLADLAAAVGVGRSALAAHFRRAYGLSVGDYLLKRRIAEAAAALARTARPIRDIAHDCGFYDQSHFTAAFRREIGATPAVYRREVA